MKSTNGGSRKARVAAAKSLNIVYRPIRELKPDPNNPRHHSKKQIQQIANSIEAFGFNVPVLIDPDGNIVAGHGRILACDKLGWSEVPTLCLDHLSPAQRPAFMAPASLRGRPLPLGCCRPLARTVRPI